MVVIWLVKSPSIPPCGSTVYWYDGMIPGVSTANPGPAGLDKIKTFRDRSLNFLNFP